MYTGFRETYPPIQAMAFVLFILKEKAMQIWAATVKPPTAAIFTWEQKNVGAELACLQSRPFN